MIHTHVFKAVAGIASVLLFFAVVFAATFFVVALVDHRPPPDDRFIVGQTISSLVALFLGGLILSVAARAFGSRIRARQASAVRPIVEAIERIARGDFDVRLDNTFHGGEAVVLGDVVKSVNRMALELGRVEQMRREFVANVSHEIQSPLTSIRGFAEALRADNLQPDERRHYLTIIETESTRLSRLTDNLLRLASLDAQQVTFDPKPFRLDKQVRNLILAGEPQWAGKGLDLDVALDEVTTRGDEDLLGQVWINLIHNSIKFTPEGGSIRISLERRGGKVDFRIADTGIGIPEDDQAHIFERFYKADKSRERSTEGSGLGLAIARKIVELHRGTITLESVPGEGTAFAVCLPGE
ncbi:MAG: sensor histidine kinase [Chloroflexota bacterium]